MRIAQEIGGWAAVVAAQRERLHAAAAPLHALPLGGTAVGTGMNAHAELAKRVCARLAELTGTPVTAAPDRFALIASMADFLHLSSALREIAIELGKIASDLRLLASGPFTGIAEVVMPAVQPGSSIMPGKVNPSIAEMVNQVCNQVVGLDGAIAACASQGQLELNVMMPVAAWDLTHALTILASATSVFTSKCVAGLSWDLERAREYVEASAGMATLLNPHIGYLAAADVAKQAVAEGKTVVQVVRERKLLTEEKLAEILDPKKLTEPGR
jgi:fumarate hydratase class II/aspartate ammonia-lyase